MGFTTNIGWTQRTWDGWVGDEKVSECCAHCYMYRLEKRFGNNPRNIRRTSDATFYAPLKWEDPAPVFTCSMLNLLIWGDKWSDVA